MELSYHRGNPSSLWKDGLQSVYLFFGEEDLLKQEASDALVAQVVSEDFADFDLDRMDGSSSTADAILASAGQVAFGSDRRMVVVRGMEAWRDRNKQGECERLADGLAKVGVGSCIVLICAAEEEEGKRKTGITVKLDNAVKKHGAMIKFEGLKGDNLARWVAERVATYGKTITSTAANRLINSAGDEMTMLENEIIKLVCYVGDETKIDERTVAEVASSSPEDVVFAAVDAISRKQTDLALKLLTEIHRYDPKPQAVAGKLLALLSRQYRMLWQAKFLAGKRIPPRSVRQLPPDIAAELPAESNIAQLAFKAPDLFTISQTYTWESLRRAFDLLLLCDLANKGSATDESGVFGADPAINLQLLIVQLAR